MNHTEDAAEPVATISARVKELRKRKGWTGTQLGEQLQPLGVNWDRSIVANLENGRRGTVSVTELLALARVFDVAPVHLLVPVDDRPFRATAQDVYGSDRVRAWVRGETALPGTNRRMFTTEAPLDEIKETVRFGGRHGSAELEEWYQEDQRRAAERRTEGEGEGDGGSS